MKVSDIWDDAKCKQFNRVYKELHSHPNVAEVYIIEIYKGVEDKLNFTYPSLPMRVLWHMIKRKIRLGIYRAYYNVKYRIIGGI